MKTVRVVAAIIEDGKTFLAAQRKEGTFRGFWEFPGGKIETGETDQEALRREIWEELGLHIDVGQFFETLEHDYPDFHLSMNCYRCRIRRGRIKLKDHLSASWLDRETAFSVEWIPADLGLVRRYVDKHLN